MFDIFSFRGRLGRAGYWRLNGLCLMALIVCAIAVALTANATNATPVNVVAVGVAIAGFFICWWMCMAIVAIGVRRLHDRGKSGLWALLYYPLYPVVAFILFDGGLPDAAAVALFGLALAIALWSVIDLGFLKGSRAMPA